MRPLRHPHYKPVAEFSDWPHDRALSCGTYTRKNVTCVVRANKNARKEGMLQHYRPAGMQ